VQYRWLLLDADGTLFDYDRAEREALRLTFEAAGHRFEASYAEAYRRINAAVWREFELGQITQERLRTRRFVQLFDEAGLDVDVERFARAYLRNLALGVDLLDEAEETLRALRGRVGLALITNGLQDVQRPRLDRSTIGGFFDVVVISEEVGAAKPDPAIFEAALARMGYPAREQVLMVGDSLTSDIAGAIRAGIDACWFNPAGLPLPPGVEVRYEIRRLRELVALVEGRPEAEAAVSENGRGGRG
jgi:YjjG family noncanonical pyrimidine nucleotidase